MSSDGQREYGEPVEAGDEILIEDLYKTTLIFLA
jgi:hypothetical protein